MKLKSILYLFAITFILILIGCSGDKKDDAQSDGAGQGDEVAYNEARDKGIQEYKIEEKKRMAKNRFACDTIALAEWVLGNNPQGTYLVDFDRTLKYNLPKQAVIYQKDNQSSVIYAVVAKSKPGERVIEVKNIVGYDQSFIDLDSTKLGTAFFYLTLLKCNNNDFQKMWEVPIPSHGGFNRISMQMWKEKNIPYIEARFYYARGIGHFDFNYFMVNGRDSIPHLLLTYEGINFKRTMTNANNDKYPDYIEHVFIDNGKAVNEIDAITFVWKDTCYVNTRNPNQTRPY